MNQGALDQLGLSPAATAVLKAHVESNLAGPNFMVSLVVAYVISGICWAVGLGVLAVTAYFAIRDPSAWLLIGVAFALPFLAIPVPILLNFRKLNRARRSAT